MQDVSENIPSDLQPRVEAALAWFNASADAQNQSFKVTGIIDPDEALAGSDELRLILCGGDRCEQRSFRVSRAIDSWSVEPIEKSEEDGEQKNLRPNWTRHPELGTVGLIELSRSILLSCFFFTVDFGDLLAAPSYGATSMMELLKKSVAPEENCLRSRVSLKT